MVKRIISSRSNEKRAQHKVQPNDIVVFADHVGMWKVIAPVNGNDGFDIRIATARLESLTLIRGAGSLEYSY